jgi:hypothetical protein
LKNEHTGAQVEVIVQPGGEGTEDLGKGEWEGRVRKSKGEQGNVSPCPPTPRLPLILHAVRSASEPHAGGQRRTESCTPFASAV